MNITKGFARKAMIFGFALSALMSATLAQADSYNFGKNVEVAYEKLLDEINLKHTELYPGQVAEYIDAIGAPSRRCCRLD